MNNASIGCGKLWNTHLAVILTTGFKSTVQDGRPLLVKQCGSLHHVTSATNQLSCEVSPVCCHVVHTSWVYLWLFKRRTMLYVWWTERLESDNLRDNHKSCLKTCVKETEQFDSWDFAISVHNIFFLVPQSL